MALVQEGGFGIWEKKDLPHLSNFESVPNFDKERQYKYFKVNVGNMSKDLEKDLGKIIRHIKLYGYVLVCQRRHFARFLILYWTSSIQFVPYIASYLSDANEEKEN
jgi:hypothetical protein